jgi:hypothetical protein
LLGEFDRDRVQHLGRVFGARPKRIATSLTLTCGYFGSMVSDCLAIV